MKENKKIENGKTGKTKATKRQLWALFCLTKKDYRETITERRSQ